MNNNADQLVDVTISTSVLLANNYGLQFDDLFGASFGSGSGMGRLRLWARFCRDAACEDPVALVRAQVDGERDDGFYTYSTASTSGAGFDKALVIPQAPVGTHYMQLIGDTERSELWSKGVCSDTTNCPGDADVVQMDGFKIEQTGSGADDNPAPWAREITIDAAGDVVEIEEVQYLGHIRFSGEEIWTPAPSDTGTLVVAMSNQADDARNYVALIDLDSASSTPGATTAASYTLAKNGGDFAGDICGFIPGGGSLYAIAIDNDGANVFELDAATGAQVSDAPIVTVPPTMPGEPQSYAWPCRGVFAEKGGDKHLYLINFKGAGALDTSSPHPLVHVNITDGSHSTPFDAYTDWAWRSIAIDSGANNVYVADMSWSKDAQNNNITTNRIVSIPVGADGTLGAAGTPVVTDVSSNNTCGSTNQWPSELTMLTLGGGDRLALGHDKGVALYDPSNLDAKVQDLDLLTFGNLFSQIAQSPDGSTFYAVPQCKADNSNHTWELPYGASTERADKNLIAILEDSAGQLAVRTTGIDVNGDSTPDHGIDMDYYHLKSYIRTFESTLSIPPVVYTAPNIVVGEEMLFVRGTGIQGNGGSSISSSGLGQVQDVGFFDLQTGHGIVFDEYMPFFDGLSSEAGRGTGKWGYDVWAGQESSVGAMYYIP